MNQISGKKAIKEHRNQDTQQTHQNNKLFHKLMNLEELQEIQQRIDSEQNLFDMFQNQKKSVMFQQEQEIKQGFTELLQNQQDNQKVNFKYSKANPKQDQNDLQQSNKKSQSEVERAEIETSSSTQKQSINKKNSCKCKKSKCLRMYCECFSNDGYCGVDCQCENCQNLPQYEHLRKEALVYLKNKYPEIKKKLDNLEKQKVEPLHCNCKKSQCRKKYCECYIQNKLCGKHCKCINCQNCISFKQQQAQKQNKIYGMINLNNFNPLDNSIDNPIDIRVGLQTENEEVDDISKKKIKETKVIDYENFMNKIINEQIEF